MTHVIVHAGFHKTGTSSLQDYLRAHRARLADRVTIYLKDDFLDAGNAARRYGMRPHPWRMWRFRRALREFLNAIPEAPVIFLSWEGFSGVMPGHRRPLSGPVRGMARAAVPLARGIVAELRHRFGPTARIEFLYTLREGESWLRSVWGHIARSIRLTEDYPAFRAGFRTLTPLDAEAATVARAIAPVPVHTAWLEEIGTLPQGPATPALRLMGFSEAEIAALPRASHVNRGNSDTATQTFLHLNRTLADPAELKQRKDALARDDHRNRP